MSNNFYQTLKKFYDDLYAKTPGIFGESSLNYLKFFFDKNNVVHGRALDIGAGEGLTSRYLSENGFEVDSIDISEKAFSALGNEELIHTFTIDILDFEFKHTYSIVNTFLVAHHIQKDKFDFLIKKIQGNTVIGGANLYRIFTTESDFYKNSNGNFYYDNGSNLNKHYHGWSIVDDKKIESQASTEGSKNIIREVTFIRGF